jgi:colicin import membrane protein
VFGFIKQHLSPLAISIALHVGIIVMFSISIAGVANYAQRPAQLTIKATVVDEDRINQALADIDRAEQDEADRKAADQQRAQDQIDQARKRREEEDRRTQQARQKRQADERVEQERQRKIREDQEIERKRLADLERRRKIEEQRVAKLKAEREAEEKRQWEATEARARAEREQQMQAELAVEQRLNTAIRAGKLDQYLDMIVQRINRNWLRPPSVTEGLECVVKVRQIPGGEVVDVQIGKCNGGAAAKRSIEAAVYRSSPLPEPTDPSLFDGDLQITFRPQD